LGLAKHTLIDIVLLNPTINFSQFSKARVSKVVYFAKLKNSIVSSISLFGNNFWFYLLSFLPVGIVFRLVATCLKKKNGLTRLNSSLVNTEANSFFYINIFTNILILNSNKKKITNY
jgi:hypothetical protein